MVSAVGKISVFRPYDPQFDTQLCRNLNVCTSLFLSKIIQLSILIRGS